MAELIEAVSRGALSDVDKLINKLRDVNSQITTINSNQIGSGVSGDRNAIAEIERLNRALAEQAQAIQRLTEQRTRSNQRTTEEIVNNRLLAQNANRAALANSTFANSYQRLSAQQAIAAQRVLDLVSRQRAAGQSQRDFNRELRNAQREFDQLNSRVIAADRAVGRFNRNVGNYPQQAIRGLKDLVGAFGLVGGVAAFAGIAKSIFDITKETQSLNLALKQVTGTQEEFIATQEFLNRIAEAYGIEINGLTKSYTGFLAASQNAIDNGSITATQIQEIFESVSKASGAMGLSVEQQQGAFLALQQMISKGNVQAEEIRGQLAERLPGAFGILARSMKVTEQELNKMLEAGTVLAADVLPAFAKELEKAYGVENLTRVESLAASTTRLSNSWTDFVKELSEGSGGVTRFFSGVVDLAAQALTAIQKLIQSREGLLKDLATDAQGRGQNNASTFINESDGAGGTAVDWANSVKNKVIPQIKDLENRLLTAENLLKSSDDQLWKFFDPNKWKQHSRAKDDIESITEALNYAKGELAAADKVLAGTEKTKIRDIELTDKQKKALEALQEKRAKAYEEELQNLYRLNQLRLKSQSDTAKSIAEDESLYIEQRIQAQQDATTIELEREKKTLEESLRRSKGNKTLQSIAWEEYYAKVRDIADKGGKEISKLQEDEFKRFQDYSQKYEGEGLNVINTDDLASEFFKKQADDAEKAAEEIKKLKEATDEYLKSFTEGFFADAGLPSLFKILNNEVAGFGENFATTFVAITEVAQEAFAFLRQNSQARFDAEYAQAEREKEFKLQFSSGTEESKAEIERQYEERRREIRRKEAEANKQQALFNIAINTAQGITAALANVPPNVPLSIVIGAIGAAQLALVGSRQIPQYKDGTDNHPGGYALVGDGGKHEVIHQPTLGWSITPNKDTLMNLEKGSKVFPDIASSGIFDSGLPDIIQLNSDGITKYDLDRIMRKHMPKSTMNVNVDKGGFKTFVRSQGGQVEKLNNNVRFKA